MLKKYIAIALSLGLLIVAGCGGNNDVKKSATDTQVKKVLKYRVMPTATSDLFDAGVKPILEKKGYKLEGVGIKDSIQREMALEEGQIDFHVDAHDAWIRNVNKTKGTHLTAILPLPTVPTGMYPGAKKNLAEIQDGDTIAFPNDASNLARSLQILSKVGWIKLDPNKNINGVTEQDIIANPKKLKFKAMKGPTINSIKQDVAFIILRGSDAYNAKLDFNSVLAAEESKDIKDPMRIALCINEKNKDSQWVKDIIEAYKSKEFKTFMGTQAKFWILPKYLE